MSIKTITEATKTNICKISYFLDLEIYFDAHTRIIYIYCCFLRSRMMRLLFSIVILVCSIFTPAYTLTDCNHSQVQDFNDPNLNIYIVIHNNLAAYHENHPEPICHIQRNTFVAAQCFNEESTKFPQIIFSMRHLTVRNCIDPTNPNCRDENSPIKVRVYGESFAANANFPCYKGLQCQPNLQRRCFSSMSKQSGSDTSVSSQIGQNFLPS